MNQEFHWRLGEVASTRSAAEHISILRAYGKRLSVAHADLKSALEASIHLVRNLDEESAEDLISVLLMPPFQSIPSLRAMALLVQGNYDLRMGRFDEAAISGESVRRLALEISDEELVGRGCLLSAYSAFRHHDFVVAKSHYEEVVIAGRRARNRTLEGAGLMGLALVGTDQGDLRSAESYGRTALSLFRADGEPSYLSRGLLNFGIILGKRGLWHDARATLEEALQLSDSHSLVEYADSARLALARILRLLGALGPAQEMVRHVLAKANTTSLSKRTIIIAHEYFADILLDQGDIDVAQSVLVEALDDARRIDPKGDPVIECLYRLGSVGLYREVTSDTEPVLALEAIALAREQGYVYELAAAQYVHARLLVKAHDFENAVDVLRGTLDLWSRIGDVFEHGRSALLLSQVVSELGDQMEAAGLAMEARNDLAQVADSRWGAEAKDWLLQLTARLASTAPITSRETRSKGLAHPGSGIEGLITADTSFRRSLSTVQKLAPRNLNILVLGESGTGKELVAQAIHKSSGRKGPFVPVNCSAFPGDLLEGELFGHARGAYTGADRERSGLIEFANRGTLFLDEIGDMPLKAQARLLRALESGEVRRLGENSPRIVDVRVVAATHRELLEMVSAGEFRLDLYYRLAGYVLRLPPIREREGDARLLVEHFLAEFSAEQDKQVTLSPEVKHQLATYSWPGNVREIRNVLHRVVSLAEHDRVVKQLGFDLEGTPRPRSLPEALEAEERKRIVDALRAHNWNKTRAAAALGSNRTTLIGKMRRLGIEQPGDPASS